jgi:hypothetical protein
LKINIVVHWVDEPRLENKRHGVDVYDMLAMLRASAQKHNECRFAFLTDLDTEAPEGWWTFRSDRHGLNVMGHMMNARAEACNCLYGNTVFLDADSLVCRPLDDLFGGDWFLKVSWVPKIQISTLLCQNLIAAKAFFQEVSRRIEKMAPCYQLFGADTAVIKEMVEGGHPGIGKDTRDRICRTSPDTMEKYNGWSPKGAYIVNFKGGRKRYMRRAYDLYFA